MEELNRIKADYELQLDGIKELSTVGNVTVSIIDNLLAGYRRNFEKVLNEHALQKFDVVVGEIKKFKDHKDLVGKYQIIYAQSLVLVVSAFESFMNDLFKFLINEHPHLVTWPSKKSISIDVSVLGYSYPTVGDLVLKSFKDEINFQNVDSVMVFCQQYLRLNLSFDKLDDIKFFQNLRHIIVHNSSRVDTGFLNAVKSIRNSLPKKNEYYKVVENDYVQADMVFRQFFKLIVGKIGEKIA